MHYWRWIGKTTDRYAEEKRWVFSFDLRELRRMPDRERKGVPELCKQTIFMMGMMGNFVVGSGGGSVVVVVGGGGSVVVAFPS